MLVLHRACLNSSLQKTGKAGDARLKLTNLAQLEAARVKLVLARDTCMRCLTVNHLRLAYSTTHLIL